MGSFAFNRALASRPQSFASAEQEKNKCATDKVRHSTAFVTLHEDFQNKKDAHNLF